MQVDELMYCGIYGIPPIVFQQHIDSIELRHLLWQQPRRYCILSFSFTCCTLRALLHLKLPCNSCKERPDPGSSPRQKLHISIWSRRSKRKSALSDAFEPEADADAGRSLVAAAPALHVPIVAAAGANLGAEAGSEPPEALILAGDNQQSEANKAGKKQ